MDKNDVQQEAEDFLSEPFETNFGFCRACVEKLLKLDPSERLYFLSHVLENITLVSQKKSLGVVEHLLDGVLFNSLIEEQRKSMEIVVKATIKLFPPTEDFAKYLLGAMDVYKDNDRKAIVLWYVVKSNLLPYAPNIPTSDLDTLPETVEKMRLANRKNMAMLNRFINFELEDLNYLQIADILQRIVPEKDPDRTFFLAFFLTKYAECISEVTKKELIKGFAKPNQEKVPPGDLPNGQSDKPPDKGGGSKN